MKGFIEELFQNELNECGIAQDESDTKILKKRMASPLNDGIHPDLYAAKRIIVIPDESGILDYVLVIGLPELQTYTAKTMLWWKLMPKDELHALPG